MEKVALAGGAMMLAGILFVVLGAPELHDAGEVLAAFGMITTALAIMGAVARQLL